MNNQPKFDPETGRPLTEQPAAPANVQPTPQPNTTEAFIQAQAGNNTFTPAPETAAPPARSANGWAIASLICGILSLVICTCCCGGTGWIPLLLGIAAIVTAILSRNGQKMSGMAVGGLVCGIVAVVLSLVVLALGLFAFDDNFWMNFSDEFLTEFEANLPEGYESFLPEDYYQYIE